MSADELLEDELEDEDCLLRLTEAVLETADGGTAGPDRVVLDLVFILPLMLSGLLGFPSLL